MPEGGDASACLKLTPPGDPARPTTTASSDVPTGDTRVFEEFDDSGGPASLGGDSRCPF
jgi:hypothetical protein